MGAEGRMGSSCLISTEFLSGMMKMSGNGGDGRCTTLQDLLDVAELCPYWRLQNVVA